MPLLPALKPMFDAQHNSPPMPDDLPPGQMRAAMHAMIEQSFFALAAAEAPVILERDITITVSGGEITLRLYRDDAGEALLPCHVYFHGGGFFLGTLDHSDTYCRGLARAVGCVVISVGYRLAPEHRFPTAAEDAFAALAWTASHALDLRIDQDLISVGGGSAGGNLAAVVAQLARDRGGPSIVAQVLEIPVTDFTSTRTLEFPDEGVHFEPTKAYAPLYLRDASDAHDPKASPLLAQSLQGLPPALVLCAEYDQLQPEGEDYARRLSQAEVPTIYRLLEGQFHGSQGFNAVIPAEAAAYAAEIASFLLRAYSKGASRRDDLAPIQSND